MSPHTEKQKAYWREYGKRPEVKQRRREQYQRTKPFREKQVLTPEQIENKLSYMQVYYQRPEVQQRYRDRQKTPAYQAYAKAYRQSDHGKKIYLERARERLGFVKGATDKLMEIQNSSCAVCKRPFAFMKAKSIHADHCHDTKKPRGLLCQECNLAEGAIKKIGLSPHEFAISLEHYLSSPPALSLVISKT